MKMISFIIPIYNDKVTDIKKAIDSIIKQKIDSYEIIIINDGSDNIDVSNFCKKYSKKYNFIKYIYQENAGSAVARNVGLKIAKGDYISFVDADDYLPDNYYNNLINYIDDECDIYLFNYSILNSVNCIEKSIDCKLCKDNIYKNILYGPTDYKDYMFGSIWGKLFKKTFLDNNNIHFISKLRKAQDRMFMLTAFYKAKRINYYPFNSYIYRTNFQSITHKLNYSMINYYNSLYNEVLSFCINNDISETCYRYFTFYIINELLLLTIFHIDNNKKYFIIKNEFFNLYKQFDLDRYFKDLKYKEFKSVKDRIKLFLLKNRLVFLLKFYFRLIQYKNNKRSFNKGE